MFAFCKREREGSHAWVGGAYSLFDETFNIILRLVSCAYRFALLGCRVDFSSLSYALPSYLKEISFEGIKPMTRWRDNKCADAVLMAGGKLNTDEIWTIELLEVYLVLDTSLRCRFPVYYFYEVKLSSGNTGAALVRTRRQQRRQEWDSRRFSSQICTVEGKSFSPQHR